MNYVRVLRADKNSEVTFIKVLFGIIDGYKYGNDFSLIGRVFEFALSGPRSCTQVLNPLGVQDWTQARIILLVSLCQDKDSLLGIHHLNIGRYYMYIYIAIYFLKITPAVAELIQY